MAHGEHGHNHHHEHGPGSGGPVLHTQCSASPDTDDRRRLLGALWLTGGFMLVEVAGGFIAGSLALIADAGHMLTDAAALGFAYVSPGRPIMTCHARVDRKAVHDRVLARALACLRERFGVRHATVQLEHERCVEPAECASAIG